MPLPAPAGAAEFKTGPQCDGMQPGRELCPACKRGAVLEEADKHLLCRVAGVVLVAHEPEADAPHALLVARDERRKGRPVRILAGCLGRQLFIGLVGDVQDTDHTSCASLGSRMFRTRPVSYRPG